MFLSGERIAEVGCDKVGGTLKKPMLFEQLVDFSGV
jgi:hypothetical protein